MDKFFEARSTGSTEDFEAVVSKDTIFASDGHLVANSAEKDEIEEPFFLAVRDFTFGYEGLGEFEGDADTGKIV